MECKSLLFKQIFAAGWIISDPPVPQDSKTSTMYQRPILQNALNSIAD